VVADASSGVATARQSTTEAEVRNRLLGAPRLDVTGDIVRTAGELLANDDRTGGSAGVGSNDASIAAMADCLDDAVLTASVEDFAAGVPVETEQRAVDRLS